MNESRNYTIDFLRTIAAFSVVVLHANYGPSDKQSEFVQVIRLCARWAVPYFFLLSGYFFEKKSRENLDKAFLGSLKNLLIIFIISNVLYSLIAAQTEFYTIGDILSLRSLVEGDFYHLWFIGSLIFGYMMLWLVLSSKLTKLMPAIAIIILVTALIIGPYAVITKPNIEGHFLRFLLSIPFLFIGFLYSKHQLQQTTGRIAGTIVAVTGILVTVLESNLLYRGNADFNPEFLLGTFLFSIGVFMLSFSSTMEKDSAISKIGRNYSLLIYLYHPLTIVVVFFIIKKLGFQNTNYVVWFNPISIFLVTFLGLKLISNYSPTLFRIISGRV
jgi:surface polysaccharide O-acyltransferase-like enzyme